VVWRGRQLGAPDAPSTAHVWAKNAELEHVGQGTTAIVHPGGGVNVVVRGPIRRSLPVPGEVVVVEDVLDVDEVDEVDVVDVVDVVEDVVDIEVVEEVVRVEEELVRDVESLMEVMDVPVEEATAVRL
jgi:hypothetical protein